MASTGSAGRAVGAALATTTTVIWGGQWVVGHSTLRHIDAFNLTAIRYAGAAACLLTILAAAEGRRALRFDGYGGRLFVLGTLGFAGFNLLAYLGLSHAPATSASLITSLSPLLSALLLWARGDGRPRRSTLVALGVAVLGVAMVLGRGNPLRVFSGALGWGDLLIVAGTASFLVYSMGAARLPGFSPLRYTAVTAAFGWVSIAAVTGVVDLAGLEHVPSGADVRHALPALAYLVLLGAVVSVTTWNLAVSRLGTQDASLFLNLLPTTTFAIEMARGYHASAAELGGAALTVAALIGGNLASRRAGDLSSWRPRGPARSAPARREP